MSQASSQHLDLECRIDDAEKKVDGQMKLVDCSMKRRTWNEKEKCWELMKNGQMNDDDENVSKEYDDDKKEVGDMNEDDQHGVDQLKELEHESNIDVAGCQEVVPNKSQTGKHVCAQCRISFSTLSDLNSHSRKYTVSKLIKCPRENCYKAFAQNADLQVHLESHNGEHAQETKEEMDIDLLVEENERSGKGCRGNELDNEQMDSDKDAENVGNNEELTVNGQMGDDDDDCGHGVDKLNGIKHDSTIEGGEAQADQRPSNMNISPPPQCGVSVELLNDQNIEHTNQTVLINSIESVPSPSYRHNTIPVYASKSYSNEHQEVEGERGEVIDNDTNEDQCGKYDDHGNEHGDDQLNGHGSNIDSIDAHRIPLTQNLPSSQSKLYEEVDDGEYSEDNWDDEVKLIVKPALRIIGEEVEEGGQAIDDDQNEELDNETQTIQKDLSRSLSINSSTYDIRKIFNDEVVERPVKRMEREEVYEDMGKMMNNTKHVDVKQRYGHEIDHLDKFNANPDQFNSNSTQSTCLNQTESNPLSSQPVSVSLDQFSANLDQSSLSLNFNSKSNFILKPTQSSNLISSKLYHESSQSHQESKLNEKVDDEYCEDDWDDEVESILRPVLKIIDKEVEENEEMMDNDQNGEQGKEHDRDTQTIEIDLSRSSSVNKYANNIKNILDDDVVERPVKRMRSEEVNEEMGEAMDNAEHVEGNQRYCHGIDHNNGQIDGYEVVVPDKPPTDKQICPYCGKFKELSDLNRHIQKHIEKRPKSLHMYPYACHYCGKRFKTQFKFNRHLLMHTEKRPFKCTWTKCNESFAQKEDFQLHLKWHTEELVKSPTGKNICEHCGKGFSSPSKLTCHIRTHTGERPFKCGWKNCEWAFARKSHRNTHYRKLHSFEVVRKRESTMAINYKTNSLSLANCGMDCGGGKDDESEVENMNEQPVISNKCSETAEKPCSFAWGGCTKTFTDDDHLKKHLELIHHHHLSKHPNRESTMAINQSESFTSTFAPTQASDLSHALSRVAVGHFLKM